MLGLCLVILCLWLACEICGRDLEQARRAPPDPFRLDRWKRGEDDPDR